ncbi:MAG TPA: Uma2 family endonuclease [Blastocatellia bacterium]|nr:Uma2 family endonuclease [Blastocatellia bacterium]
MSHALPEYQPNIAHLITEDDEPVDNIPSAKQQRLLTETLYSSWPGPGGGRKFLAEANIGVFYLAKNPAIVPDVLLSLDVEVHPDFWSKEHRSYFLWEFGKPPDVVIEIVSNQEGGEDSDKLRKYERMKIGYYIIFDPEQYLSAEVLRIFRLEGFTYRPHESLELPEIGLGLVLWQGEFEGVQNTWLRWTDERGNLILTGRELAEKERAEKEQERAEKEAAMQRAEKLAARLRELGQDPDKLR